MLDEALTFLEQTRGEFNLPHKVGEKTLQTLNSLILHRPLGEVLYLIWKACNDAAASAQKATNNRSQASNLVIGNMERMHLRAKQIKWNLPGYKRFQFQEQNWLSYAYFNLVLELPGAGLEYSWLDIMKKQNLHKYASKYGPLAESSPEAVEALMLHSNNNAEKNRQEHKDDLNNLEKDGNYPKSQ